MTGRSASEWSRIGLLALMPLLLARPAGAQGQLRVVVEGEAGLRNDGDYGLQQQDQAVRRNQDLARAGLDLQLSYAARERLNLALGYSPSYERSLHDSTLSGTTQRLDFGLIGDLTRTLRLNVRDRLLSTPSLDLYAPATTPATTVVTRNGSQLNNTADVDFEQVFSHRASLVLGVTHDLHRYQDANLYDSETLGGRIGASFELVRGQRLEALAGDARFDYKQRGNADIRTLGVAYSTDLGRGNHGRIEGGVYAASSTVQQVGGPAAERFTDQGWRGALQFDQARRLFHWNLGLSHDISPGAGLGRAVTADNAFLGISTSVGRRLTLGLDGNGSRQRTLPGDRLAMQGNPNDAALTEFAAGTARFGWSFAPAFRLDGGYSRVWQRSRVASFANLSYGRYFLNLAFRIYSTGETPVAPENLGRTSTNEKPDAH